MTHAINIKTYPILAMEGADEDGCEPVMELTPLARMARPVVTKM
jgi:hypothetical protein